jgi:leucyl/phenylalanyl-tRNA--protein transferase
LYGIELGDTIFCGESMFSHVSNASKIGFITFIRNSNYTLIDCQLHTDYLESLGAEHISRSQFMEYIKRETT